MTSSDSGGGSDSDGGHSDNHCICSHSVLRLTLFSIHSAHSHHLSLSLCCFCVLLSLRLPLSSVCKC